MAPESKVVDFAVFCVCFVDFAKFRRPWRWSRNRLILIPESFSLNLRYQDPKYTQSDPEM